MQKSVAILHTKNETSEREIKETLVAAEAAKKRGGHLTAL